MPTIVTKEAIAQSEVSRILSEYENRERNIPEYYYSVTNPTCFFRFVQRTRAIHKAFRRYGFLPLKDKKILDVGCGKGEWLVELETWGARQELLHGIDLDSNRIEKARRRLPAADLRIGHAEELPWPDHTFDLVIQATLFTSILSDTMKQKIATEMLRILKPNGVILWYDFRFNNPHNPNVKAVTAQEIISLFPDAKIEFNKETLAPPITERLIRFSWIACLLLEKIPFLRTHYLGVIRKKIIS